MKIRNLFILIYLLIAASTCCSKIIPADNFLRKSGTAGVAGATYYSVDSAALTKYLSGGHIQITNFPGGIGDLVTLDLKPTQSAIDAKTECIVTSPQGDMHVSPPSIICYRGKVLGEEHSSVFVSVSGGQIICSMLRENGTTYVFGPKKNSTEAGAHLLIAETDLVASAPFTPFDCISDDIHQPKIPTPVEEILAGRSHNEIQAAPLDNGKLLQTDIAVEADSQFYGAIGGDPTKTIAYIGSIFSMSSMIYENEANLTHHLSWIKVWTTSDPYQVKGNAYLLEDTVKSYWQLHYQNVQRDLAHIMTSIGNGGGGFGYYSLCDNANSYSVSSPQTGHTYPTFAFTYDVYIISHEIGHNFTLIHTHDCYWNPPLDTCYTKDDASLSLSDACYGLPVVPHKSPGTIMSYCANTNYILSGKDFSQYKIAMTFSHRPDSVMRYNAEHASCIQPPTDPVVILLSPRGGESYAGGDSATVKWTYANVQNVTLEYSTNSGTAWLPIQNGVPASQGALRWKLPNITSTKMLVRIYDASNSTTGDTSILFFSLAKNSVSESAQLADAFTLNPNPAKALVTLSSRSYSGTIDCTILDELGKAHSHFKGLLPQSGLQFDLHGFPAGKYFLKIFNDSGEEAIINFVVE
jgi:hypothetical protein